jgi:hypothetical protein
MSQRQDLCWQWAKPEASEPDNLTAMKTSEFAGRKNKQHAEAHCGRPNKLVFSL